MTFSPGPAALRREGPPAPWLPDQGDGTYRNPVLFADYSDPDAIRAGEDYWLTSSSFGHVPGLPILHSRDLVNWTLVNHALPRLVPEDHFASPRHGGGVWAPTIRHHGGKFWIFYPDPDFGIYVITADDPRQAWTKPVRIAAGKGLIDPCPFWDTDGSGYLVHAWARSRSGIRNRLTLHRLRPDGRGVDGPGETIVDGDAMPGWHTIEGPKVYRRGEYYYIFAPAGGVRDGYQAVFRSRSIHGPYEKRIVLARGGTAINGPHQGAWVDTPEGTDWFLHFQELPAHGRVVHLQPMRWEDDWPAIGAHIDVAGTGEPVPGGPLPRRVGSAPVAPATSDDFDLPSLGLQWQWQANPRPEWASLRAPSGWLRLPCLPQPPATTLWNTPHLLLQKFPAPQFEATALLEFAPLADGDTAGLVVFGFSYAWLGVRRERGAANLRLHHCDDAHEHGQEREIAVRAVPAGRVFLRVSVSVGACCQFGYSTDGHAFSPVGAAFQARSSYWVGAKVGLFACSAAGPGAATGHADFDWFRVTPISP